MKFIPVANPYLTEEDAQAVYETVKSGWLSQGKKVAQFEEDFRSYIGVKHAIAVNNGTSAIHLILAALDIKEGDEVIIPSMTFISTANVVLYQRATPVLTECDPKTYNITAEEIERRITDKTKAVIAVDMNGMPVDYDAIQRVCDKHSVYFIADSAESLGATYKNRKIGSIAPAHMFSFFPNKNVTTAEGGMITTNDDVLAAKMRMLRNQGQDYRYNHVILGYNYRMTELQAALGIVQLKRLDWIIEEKNKLVRRYNERFANNLNIHIPHVPEYVTQHAWYMYAVSINEGPEKRDNIVRKLTDAGIGTRLSFPPIHSQPLYTEKYGYHKSSLPITQDAWSKLIDIPIWVGLKEEEQNYVMDSLEILCKPQF
jgi:perosamine synthetase